MYFLVLILAFFIRESICQDSYSLPEYCANINPVTVIDAGKIVGKWITVLQTPNVPFTCEVINQTSCDPRTSRYNAVATAFSKKDYSRLVYHILDEVLVASKPAAPYLFLKSGFPIPAKLFFLAADPNELIIYYTCFKDEQNQKTEIIFVDSRTMNYDGVKVYNILKANNVQDIPLEYGCRPPNA